MRTCKTSSWWNIEKWKFIILSQFPYPRHTEISIFFLPLAKFFFTFFLPFPTIFLRFFLPLIVFYTLSFPILLLWLGSILKKISPVFFLQALSFHCQFFFSMHWLTCKCPPFCPWSTSSRIRLRRADLRIESRDLRASEHLGQSSSRWPFCPRTRRTRGMGVLDNVQIS